MIKVGRNDPCICGSGRKYKQCCLVESKNPWLTNKEPLRATLSKTLEAANHYLRSGQLAEAEIACRQVLQIQPDQPQALHNLGIIAIKVEQYEVAVELLTRSMQSAPGAAVCCNLGLALKALGHLEAAVEIYRDVLRYQPDHAATHHNLANALRKLGDLSGAIRHYQEAIQYQPDYADAITNLNSANGVIKILESQLVRFGIELDFTNNFVSIKGVQIAGNSTGFSNFIELLTSTIIEVGVKFQQAGEISNAEDLYQAVRQINPNNTHALHLLGHLAKLMGRKDLGRTLAARLIDSENALRQKYEDAGSVFRVGHESGFSGSGGASFVFTEPKYPKIKALDIEELPAPKNPGLNIRAPGSQAWLVEIVSATRRSEVEFWENSALGISLRGMGAGARVVANIAFNNQLGLSELYNRSIQSANPDRILVFMHDDVWIDDLFFAERLNHGLANFDVIGVAGNSRRVPFQAGWGFMDEELTPSESSDLRGSIAHGKEPFGEIAAFGESPAECELLDGVILAARKSRLLEAQVAFDPIFKFHFYDIDFCRAAREKKLRVGTWPIHLTHQSEGAFKSAGWREMYARYLEKWTS